MIKEKFNANGNYLKMNILFLLLIISNVVLLAGLIYYYSRAGIGFRIETYEYFSSVIPTIIILGFITSKLANLREREGSLYEMAYLVIITILGLMTSYFSAKSNTEVIFGSYLEMFRMLCVILIFVLIALKLKPFRQIMHGDYSRRNLLVCFIIFAVFGISASIFYIDVNGTPANVRCMVVMLSGMFGGPFVGIPVGIVSGAYRFTLGGATALPCAISTVISGIVGSLIFWWSGRKYPRPIAAVAAIFFFTGFEMLVVIMMTPPEISFPFITGIYPIMLFSSVIGVILFSIVVQDRLAQGDSTDEDVVEQLGDEISRSGGIQDLKDEITWLKSEINKLKKD